VATTRERPLSPHLQVYRWQITMTLSILHRASGVVLAIGAFAVAWWLVAMAAGGDVHATFARVAGSPLGWLVGLAMVSALVYHFFSGLRHLVWDTGRAMDIPDVYRTGWAVVGATVVVTALVWFVALSRGGVA
jgi:succinate dehydrogenase / fumarate reductase, cytochrome b subunit